MVQFDAITPDQYKKNPAKFKIIYGFHSTPFGECLIGVTDSEKAVMHLTFADKSHENALSVLKQEWPLSELAEDTSHETEKLVQEIFSEEASIDDTISVLLKGTEFQVKVWEFLVTIPHGTSTTYEKVAQSIQKPKAVRAVANAIMKNQVAYLVPCHRVMGKSGSNKYSWGTERKQNILTYESKCH